MIALQAYRQQIGYFNQVLSGRNSCFKKYAEYTPVIIKSPFLRHKTAKNAVSIYAIALCLVLILGHSDYQNNFIRRNTTINTVKNEETFK